MLYFVKRPFALDGSKAQHRKKLHDDIYGVLKSELLAYHTDFDSNISYNEYGKPYLKNSGVFFNISHCIGLAVCGIDNCEIGVDVENIREFPERVLKRSFSQREAEAVISSESPDETFFRVWTLKESFVKAVGIGISYPLNTAEFLFEGSAIKAIGCDGFSFVQFVVNDAFICSVCLKKQVKNEFKKIYSDNDFFTCNY